MNAPLATTATKEEAAGVRRDDLRLRRKLINLGVDVAPARRR